MPGQRDRARSTANFLRTVWVEYGCPGHGKGPWDGLGVTAKTKVTTDITDGNERTPSGKITCALIVAQHLRAVLDSQEWMSIHMEMKINQVVVMYLDIEEILRPVSPPVVSVRKGILTAYSFLFFGTQGITQCENTIVGVVLVLAYADAVRAMALSHEVHIWMFLTAPATSSLFGGKIISP